MKQKLTRGLAALLCAVVLLSALPTAARADSETGFPDVQKGIWYEDELIAMQTYTPGIINGLYNKDGVLIFDPTRPVRRGEFLKMAMTAAEGYTADKSRNNNPHWAGEYYTIALENNILTPNILGGEDHDDSAPDKTAVATEIFPYTFEDMQQEISRYEMAVIIKNTCANMMREKTVNAENAAQYIQDYQTISEDYTIYEDAVAQAYGKGLLMGYEDNMFHGERSLSRAEAAVVIYRMLWANDRNMPEWAAYPEATTSGAYRMSDPNDSFAHWLNGTGNYAGKGRHYSYPGGRTTLDSEAKYKLFGDYYTDHLTSSYHASQLGCIETVDVPIWTVDSMGNKIASTVGIQVNKAVADEVHDIFQTIFDDPEQFPIYGGWSAGGARYTDDMRHSWGCAIDVNALYNCECNKRYGYVRITCGYGWWPINTVRNEWIGSLTAPSIYSIGKNPGDYGHSVVEAFAKYGWGWGGNGWSGGTSFDYMHFSVLSSGG